MGFRSSIGVSRPSQLADRGTIIQSIATHYSVVSMKAELDQIVDGLNVLVVLNLFESHPNTMRPLLICKQSALLTSDYVIDLFKPVMSVAGSNQREAEDRAVLQWVNYVHLIEGKLSVLFIQCFFHV